MDAVPTNSKMNLFQIISMPDCWSTNTAIRIPKVIIDVKTKAAIVSFMEKMLFRISVMESKELTFIQSLLRNIKRIPN